MRRKHQSGIEVLDRCGIEAWGKVHQVRELSADAEWLIFLCGRSVRVGRRFANPIKPTCRKCLVNLVLREITG